MGPEGTSTDVPLPRPCGRGRERCGPGVRWGPHDAQDAHHARSNNRDRRSPRAGRNHPASHVHETMTGEGYRYRGACVMPSRTLTTRSIRRTAMASVLAGLAFASTAHAGTTGTVSRHQRLHLPRRHADQPGTRVAGRRRVRGRKRRLLGAWGSNVSWLSDLSSPAAPISSSLETRRLRRLPRQVQRHRRATTSARCTTGIPATSRPASTAPTPSRCMPASPLPPARRSPSARSTPSPSPTCSATPIPAAAATST